MYKVFIDGKEGTTGLRIYERFLNRDDIEVLNINEELRKDPKERAKMINASDITFLCLPDDAAREALTLVTNPNTKIIDTSTAHRTIFDYGFPELSPNHLKNIENSKRVSVPGCHATGFISIVYPLIQEKIIDNDYPLICNSITGYSGGGKKMIAEYENPHNIELDSPRIYGLSQNHKHIKEIMFHTNLKYKPIFNPIVAPYYNGMLSTISFHKSLINKTINEIHEMYSNYYKNQELIIVKPLSNDGMIASNTLMNKDILEIIVTGDDECINVSARFDNLGKGASGAAIECMNIMLGLPKSKGLEV